VIPWGNETTDFDWRFKVHRVVVNNPRFDKKVFDAEIASFPLNALTKTVKGTVVYSNGFPVKGATVRIDASEHPVHFMAFADQPTDKFGSFVIRGVPHRVLSLMAYIPPPAGAKDTTIKTSATVEVGPDESNVIVTLDAMPPPGAKKADPPAVAEKSSEDSKRPLDADKGRPSSERGLPEADMAKPGHVAEH
jgi:hypothetical protein